MESLLFFLLIGAPISIGLHEFGHALGAYIFKSDYIYFTVGNGRKLLSLNKGRIYIAIHTLIFLGGHVTYNRKRQYTRVEQIIISLGGPFCNGIIAFLCWQLKIMENDSLRIFFWFNIWLAVVNLLPFRFRDKKSDGYICFELLVNNRQKNQ
jgi:hypothetical protein